VFAETRPIFITCPSGNAPFLAKELKPLGLPVASTQEMGVQTEGSLLDAMRLNLEVRTGHRVLVLLHSFPVSSAQDLYRGVYSLPWEDYLLEREYLSVHSFVDTPSIRDSRYVNLKCKDGIVDRMRSRLGARPDSGPDARSAVVFVHWQGEQCRVYLDTSGESLSNRGYRKIPLAAPLRESTAAAVVMASGWQGEDHFVNPMCGSGTLAIEAALLALRRAPGLLRSNFGFMHLRGFPRPAWEDLRRKARAAGSKSPPGRITATDHDPKALDAGRKNARTAGVDQHLEFRVCGYEKTPVPPGTGAIVLNPEYGERLGREEDLGEIYRGIGDFFKQKCRGYTGCIFTGNLELAKQVGLRPRRRHIFFSGNIECRLLVYDLYEGSRKKGKATA
jgi:23S rRNA G2445 N2-methylase RlmL